MRSVMTAAVAALALLLAGCASQRGAGTAQPRPDLIVVREFAVSPAVISLDPTLGYSLHRGAPGVPPLQRADSVGRAAAFNLADAITAELKGLGYAVEQVEAGSAEPPGRALVVTGAFRHIYEGHRRFGANAQVTVAVEYQAPGAAPRPLTTFELDSRTLATEPGMPAAARDNGVDYQASRIGAAIARYVADVARRNNWPGAAR